MFIGQQNVTDSGYIDRIHGTDSNNMKEVMDVSETVLKEVSINIFHIFWR